MPTYEIDLSNRAVYFVTGTLTTVAIPLGSSLQDLTELVIQADPDNTVNIVLGDATTQGWKLIPGEWFNIPIRNPALIYGKTTAGSATYSLFGRKGD